MSYVFAFVVGSVGWLFGCSIHMAHARPPTVVDLPGFLVRKSSPHHCGLDVHVGNFWECGLGCGLGCGLVVFWMTWEVCLVSCVFAFVVGSVGWLFGCSTHMAHVPLLSMAGLRGILQCVSVSPPPL